MPLIKLLKRNWGNPPNQVQPIEGVRVVHLSPCVVGCAAPPCAEYTDSSGNALLIVEYGLHTVMVEESAFHQGMELPDVLGDNPQQTSPIGITVQTVTRRPLLRNDVKLTYRITLLELGNPLQGVTVRHGRELCGGTGFYPPTGGACAEATIEKITNAQGTCEFQLKGLVAHFFAFARPGQRGRWIRINPTEDDNNDEVIERTREWDQLMAQGILIQGQVRDKQTGQLLPDSFVAHTCPPNACQGGAEEQTNADDLGRYALLLYWDPAGHEVSANALVEEEGTDNTVVYDTAVQRVAPTAEFTQVQLDFDLERIPLPPSEQTS